MVEFLLEQKREKNKGKRFAVRMIKRFGQRYGNILKMSWKPVL